MPEGKNKAPAENKVQADRRRTFRHPMIVLRVKIENGRKSFFGYAKNISRGGMFVATVNPPEPGCSFQVEFTLPDKAKTTVHCSCQVVWKRAFTRGAKYEPGMGMKFLDLPEPLGRAIETWVVNNG